MNNLEKKIVEIAQRKLEQGISSDKIFRPRLGTGGNFADIFLWDTTFTAMWAKYYADDLPVDQSMDNLYRLQDEDGFICRQYLPTGEAIYAKKHPISFAPPVLSWLELDYYKFKGDRERLRQVYPYLKKHNSFCLATYQNKDGLFTGDPFGCGMDNLPRWPRDWQGDDQGMPIMPEHVHKDHRNPSLYFKDGKGLDQFSWNLQAAYIDMSAQMAFNALCLREIAEILKISDDAEQFGLIHKRIKNTINKKCWNNDHKFYFDLGYDKQIERFHIGSFWTLIADIVPKDNLDPFLSKLVDPEKFGRSVPIPSLAFDDPDYDPKGGYWQGSSWPPTTYMALKGLKKVGAGDLAKKLASKYCDAVEKLFAKTGTLWENLSPEAAVPGQPSQPDFCGWAGLVLAIQKEIL